MSDSPRQVTGPADDPEVVAKALNLLSEGFEAADRNLLALGALMGMIVANAAPNGHPLRTSAQSAVDVLRQAIPGANVLAAFEAGMDLAGRLPPHGGGSKVTRLRAA